MPFMDDAMLDLFGDEAVGDGLVSFKPLEPPSRRLLERVDEMHRTGCCQRLAWSRSGTITNISDDGHTIHLRTIVRNLQTNQWTLGEPAEERIIAPEGVCYQHIQWSSLGLDLVAVDQYGRCHVWTLAYALDRIQLENTPLTPVSDETNAIVGLHWLSVFPQQSKPPWISSSTRVDDKWSSQIGVHQVDWPHHAVESKSVFLTVTESHTLKITYQQDGAPWSETAISLNESMNPEDVLTHATFADAEGFLYLATYNTDRVLRLYRVSISWPSAMNTNGTPGYVTAQAHLSVQHLQIIDNCVPQPPILSTSLDMQQSLLESRLASITIVPPLPSADPGPYQILAIFTNAGDTSSLHGLQTSCSCIVRWEFDQADAQLLDVFKTLKGAAVKPGFSESEMILTRTEDIVIPKVVIGISFLPAESVVALTHSDGSIDFRDRAKLDLLFSDGSDATAGFMGQTGFAFVNTPRCYDVALSPDSSLAIHQTIDGALHFTGMEYLPAPIESDLGDFQIQAALVSVARQTALMTSQYISADEPLMFLPPNLGRAHRRFLTKQVCRIIGRPGDSHDEDPRRWSSRCMRDGVMARVMSQQLMFGFDTDPAQADITGKVAWVYLNLKMICTSLAPIIRPKDTIASEAFIASRHWVKWCVDLTVMILDDLAGIHQSLAGQPFDVDALRTLIQTSNSPSFHLLLTSTTRGLLRMTFDLIRMYFNSAATAVTAQSVAQKCLLQEIAAYARTVPFKIPIMEHLLNELDSSVHKAFHAAGHDRPLRTDAEARMLIDADVPPALAPVAEHLVAKVAPMIMDAAEAGRIAAWDVAWLGLRDVPGLTTLAQRARYDVVLKTPVRTGVRLRSCRRCGSVMEDLPRVEGRELPALLVQAQKSCVCLGHWMMER